MREEALLFGKTRSLVGIITNPSEIKRDNNHTAIIIMNAGLIHRVGPNRLYVKMARNLATIGFMVLRFDFSGIGDSPVRTDKLHFFKRWISELQEAMDYLQETRGIDRFIPMGICGGAYVSYKAACCDSRIVGAALFNAVDHLHDFSNDGLTSLIRNRTLARHYWRIAFFSSFSLKNWLKVIKIKFDYGSVIGTMIFQLRSLFAHKKKVHPGVNNAAAGLRLLTERGVHLIHIYSEGDEGFDYFHLVLGDKLKELISNGSLRIEMIQGANHTFTLLENQKHLLEIIRNWAQEMMNTEFHGL